MLYAAAYLPNYQDRNWSRYLTLHQKGDIYDRDYSIPVAEFTDPGTGLTWRAPRYPALRSINGRDVEPSIGAAFLDGLNETYQAIEAQDGAAAALDFVDSIRWKLDWWYTMHEFFNVNG